MTPEQIKALIAAKIAGQGNQVDIAGALPTILNEIVDAIADTTGPAPFIFDGTFDGETFDANADDIVAAKAAYQNGSVVIARDAVNNFLASIIYYDIVSLTLYAQYQQGGEVYQIPIIEEQQ